MTMTWFAGSVCGVALIRRVADFDADSFARAIVAGDAVVAIKEKLLSKFHCGSHNQL